MRPVLEITRASAHVEYEIVESFRALQLEGSAASARFSRTT